MAAKLNGKRIKITSEALCDVGKIRSAGAYSTASTNEA
jgi:hypothetical protein